MPHRTSQDQQCAALCCSTNTWYLSIIWNTDYQTDISVLLVLYVFNMWVRGQPRWPPKYSCVNTGWLCNKQSSQRQQLYKWHIALNSRVCDHHPLYWFFHRKQCFLFLWPACPDGNACCWYAFTHFVAASLCHMFRLHVSNIFFLLWGNWKT